jgi:Uma2 family endonuclease
MDNLAESNPRYTIEQWGKLDIDGRSELIHGALYMMAASTIKHGRVAGTIYNQLTNYLSDKTCEAFSAPIDVELSNVENTIVEPDVIVVCDPNKITDKRIVGAPDLAVEVLSPSTSWRDQSEKLLLYQRAMVREYWLVDPETLKVIVYLLKDGLYELAPVIGEKIKVNILDDCIIDLGKIRK